MVDVPPVPERLEDAVPEPEDQQVAHRLLAEVVIDAVDLRLAEDLADFAVQALGRLEVVSERLLDDDPPPATVVVLVIESHATKLGDEVGELRRLRGQVEEPVATGPVLLVDRLQAGTELVEPGGVGEVQPVIEDPLLEGPPGRRVERQHTAELLERGPDLFPERLVVVLAPTDREDQELVGQQVRPPELVERGKDLAMGEIAGRPEQDQYRRIRHALQAQALAQDVLGGFRPRGTFALARFAEVLHRSRRVLRPRGRSGRDRLIGRRLVRVWRLDRGRLPDRGRFLERGPHGTLGATGRHPRYPVLTAWPPNSLRNAARTLAPYKSS